MSSVPTRVDVAIVGAGQAGLSLGACLNRRGIDHVVLEKDSVANAWRSQRWDSFCLVTPNWSVRLAHQDYDGDDPDGFMSRDAVVRYLEMYAARERIHVCTGQEVVDARHSHGAWRLRTAAGAAVAARVLVVATATHQRPRRPALAELIGVPQLHTADYRNPNDIPPGTVLVVGSGQSGAQIAWELHTAGRDVILATSRVGRVPRRHLGKDVIAWQRDLGFLDRHISELADPALRFKPDPLLSGQYGGQDINLHDFADAGVQLAGRLKAVSNGFAEFDDSLSAHLAHADAAADDFYAQVARHLGQTPPSRTPARPPPKGIDRAPLGSAGINSVLWATGYDRDFGWLSSSSERDTHIHGTCAPFASSSSETDTHLPFRQADFLGPVAGLHFLGFNYVDHRRSGILYGAGVEATRLADRIVQALDKNSRKPQSTTQRPA
ncbi:MAG: NAD(P)-binding domain-containing protein [Pseudomonadota bacterium]